MKKIIESRFSELSKNASLIIRHGMQLSCLLISAGLILYMVNMYSGNYSPSQSTLSKYIIEAAVTISAEIIIGGLMFDYMFKKHKSE